MRHPACWLYHRCGVVAKNHLVGSLCATETTEETRELALYLLALLVLVLHSVDPVDEAKVLACFQAHDGLPALLYYKEIQETLFSADRYRQPDFSQMLYDATSVAVQSCSRGLRPLLLFDLHKQCAWEQVGLCTGVHFKLYLLPFYRSCNGPVTVAYRLHAAG